MGIPVSMGPRKLENVEFPFSSHRVSRQLKEDYQLALRSKEFDKLQLMIVYTALDKW